LNWLFDDGNGNSVTAQQLVVVSCSSAGLNDVTASGLLVYPVPASGTLTIESASLAGETVLIYDAQGQKVLEIVLESAKTTLNVSTLTAGFYFLKAGAANARFVINN
jgi:hypothetical protein